ncbi:hypothetical protein NKH28_31305 [Mesorhizobium sp. M1227]|uniref:hypothetical protein n=1 Tax=unclassified Mesorhizobium TaxID=325217 RepID=UPI003337E320
MKTVRSAPWYVNKASFVGDLIDQVTIYVLLGKEDGIPTLSYDNDALTPLTHVEVAEQRLLPDAEWAAPSWVVV